MNINKLIDKVYPNRYTTTRFGYKSDRLLFNLYFIICLVLLYFTAFSNNFQLDYYKCGGSEYSLTGRTNECKNPFYNPSDSWKSEEYLPIGEYGNPNAKKIIDNLSFALCILFISILIINHFLNNKNFKFERIDV